MEGMTGHITTNEIIAKWIYKIQKKSQILFQYFLRSHVMTIYSQAPVLQVIILESARHSNVPMWCWLQTWRHFPEVFSENHLFFFIIIKLSNPFFPLYESFTRWVYFLWLCLFCATSREKLMWRISDQVVFITCTFLSYFMDRSSKGPGIIAEMLWFVFNSLWIRNLLLSLICPWRSESLVHHSKDSRKAQDLGSSLPVDDWNILSIKVRNRKRKKEWSFNIQGTQLLLNTVVLRHHSLDFWKF